MTATTLGTGLIRKSRPERTWLQSQDAVTEIMLGKGQLWRVDGQVRWRAILCLEGAIWVTQDGDLRDHIIEAGEMFLISQRGKLIAQALLDARMQITPCLATRPCRTRFLEETILP